MEGAGAGTGAGAGGSDGNNPPGGAVRDLLLDGRSSSGGDMSDSGSETDDSVEPESPVLRDVGVGRGYGDEAGGEAGVAEGMDVGDDDRGDDSEDEEGEGQRPGRRQMPRHVQRALWRILVGDTNRGPEPATNKELVDALKRSRVLQCPSVTACMEAIPRGDFVPEEHKTEAYIDSPLALARLEFNISAPHIHATCLEKLELEEGHDFLDVGSGSGIVTAYGAFLVGKQGTALGVDINPRAIELSLRNLQTLRGSRPDFAERACACDIEQRNVFLPDQKEKRYDRINVAGNCPSERIGILLQLLKEGGKLIAPCGQELQLYSKTPQGAYHMEVVSYVRFGDLHVPTDAEIVTKTLEIERDSRLRSLSSSPAMHEPGAWMRAGMGGEEPKDCFLVGGGGAWRVPVHKALLESSSTFFQAQFASGMKDADGSEFLVPEAFAEPATRALVAFLYTGQASLVTPENALPVLQVAAYYACEAAQGRCEQVLQAQVCDENAADLLVLSHEAGLKGLKEVAMDYIVHHYEAVGSTGQGLARLDKKLVAEVASLACGLYANVLAVLKRQAPAVSIRKAPFPPP